LSDSNSDPDSKRNGGNETAGGETVSAEERTAALTALRAALKSAVDPDSLPPYCPARPIKRQRRVAAAAASDDNNNAEADVSTDGGGGSGIAPFIFEVRKRSFLAIYINDLFTKTGSGQT
jgi:hypothetical protein